MIMGHPLKTKNLHLPEVLKLNDCDIERVNKAKSLGVIIYEMLSWLFSVNKALSVNGIQVLLESSFIVIFHVSAFNNFISMYGIESPCIYLSNRINHVMVYLCCFKHA